MREAGRGGGALLAQIMAAERAKVAARERESAEPRACLPDGDLLGGYGWRRRGGGTGAGERRDGAKVLPLGF